MKVHILICGWDKERSIWGCMKIGADKVYIVLPNERVKTKTDKWISDKTREIAYEIQSKFSKYFEIEMLPVDYENYLDCFKKIIRTIRKEKNKGNEVYVNISSGSHVATSAAIFAASITRCNAYYVIAERYDEFLKEKNKFISYGGKAVVDVPLLPVNCVSETELELLKVISKHKSISISELSKIARNLFTEPTRSKFNYYVNKLADEGFLKNEIISGRMYTKITDAGKMILEALS
jgi:predicted transcriptional regulator